MNFIEFKEKMFELACFNIHQIYAWQPGFDRNNLTRWVKKGYLTRLRQGYFSFPEYKSKLDYAFYFANRIYRPSYISLHSALAFYGMIPEAVVQITSITSLKTASFRNDFGEYSYRNVKENLMFGYELKPIADGRTIQFASPEKALLDLLYLYSFYDGEQELEELRLDEHILKEYIQLMILDHLSSSPYIQKMTFIGGTNLRLVKGIDRFSEDLNFDCKDLSKEEFAEMTNGVILFLERSGMRVEARDKDNPKLTAFRRNIHFPELLFDLGLSGLKEERFLIKIESQDQGIRYQPVMANLKGCGFFFPFPVPSDGVLCSMKIAAMLAQSKGRDFYDLMFLLAQARPDYDFLSKRCGIHNLHEFKQATGELLKTVDLKKKQKDFEHLLFNKAHSENILRFEDFINSLTE